jgi:hypothetical protein
VAEGERNATAAALGEVDARLGQLRRQRDELQTLLDAAHEKGDAWAEQVVRSFELVELLREATIFASSGPRKMLLRGHASNYSVEGKLLVWKPRSPFREVGQTGGRLEWCPEEDSNLHIREDTRS